MGNSIDQKVLAKEKENIGFALLLFSERFELADITALQPRELKAGAGWGLREVIRKKHDINFL